jgi:hypothetical protein
MTDPLTRLTLPDPHAVRAWIVTITAVDLTSGTCTIDPQDGDLVPEVPFWGAAPAVGTVQVALLFDGLLGILVAGSGGSPVSGVWPNAPGLDYWANGNMPSTSGLPIYLDSSGQLRTRPDVWQPATGKGVADSPATYPLGMSIMSLTTTQATTGGWPLATTAVVVTFKRYNDDVAAQWWYANSTGTPRVWYRLGNTGVWSPWVKVVEADAGWVPITILPGFAASGVAAEAPAVRLKNGIVYARGAWTNAGISAINTTYQVGSIPAGYWPIVNTMFRAGTSSGLASAGMYVYATGAVYIRTGPNLSTYYFFGGQSWPID